MSTTTRTTRRLRTVVVGAAVAALLAPGAAVAAPADPPGALPVVGPVVLPSRVQALLDRLPAVPARPVGGEVGPGSPLLVDGGVVAGTGVDGSGAPRAFRWRDGVRTDFPAAPGDTTQAAAVDARGVVAVNVWHDDDGPFPVLWHPDGTVQELPAGVFGASVAALGDDGTAVGSATLATPAPGSEGDTAVAWRDGVLTDLAPGGFDASARDVNARGVVVGLTHRADLDNTGWVWRDGTTTDLAAPAGARSTAATHVNDRGDVAGSVRLGDREDTGALWVGGTDLRYLGGTGGYLTDLDERGTAVGVLWRDTPYGVGDPVTVDRHRVTRLRVDHAGGAVASAVDDLGVVVAGHQGAWPSRRAAVWVHGVPVALTVPAGWEVVESAATDVADGRVVGWVRLPDATPRTPRYRAVVWDLLPTAAQVARWLP